VTAGNDSCLAVAKKEKDMAPPQTPTARGSRLHAYEEKIVALIQAASAHIDEFGEKAKPRRRDGYGGHSDCAGVLAIVVATVR
jgi:hypothetical protein